MKKILKTIFLLVFVLQFQGTQAQILKNITKKVENRTKAKADAKLNEAIDKELDKIEKEATKKSKENKEDGTGQPTTKEEKIDQGEGEEVGKILGTLGESMGKLLDFDVQPKSNYSFSSSATTKVTMVDKKGKLETQYMKMLFHKDQPAVGMEMMDETKKQDESNILIMDMEQTAFFTFTTNKKGEKTYFGMRIKAENLEDTAPSDTPSPTPLTKTGKTKTIMGVICEGYLTKEAEGEEITFWVASINSINGIQGYYESMRKYGKTAPSGFGDKKQAQSSMEKSMEELMKQGKVVLGSDTVFKDGNKMMTELQQFNLNDTQNFSTTGYISAFGK